MIRYAQNGLVFIQTRLPFAHSAQQRDPLLKPVPCSGSHHDAKVIENMTNEAQDTILVRVLNQVPPGTDVVKYRVLGLQVVIVRSLRTEVVANDLIRASLDTRKIGRIGCSANRSSNFESGCLQPQQSI